MTQIRLVALWAISIAVLLGAALNRPLEAQTAQLLAKLNAVDHNLRWAAYGPHGIIVVMPYGPCATLNQMAPTQIGLSTGDSGRIVLYPTWESATLAARRHCVAQFAHTKANRTAMAEINAQWMKDHPQGDHDVEVEYPNSPPRLPQGARDAGVWSETLYVQATVDEHGQVTHVNVSRVTDAYPIDQDVVDAYLKQFKFVPAVKAGKPITASVSFEISFR
jgi:hypothetical protein